LIHRGVQSYLDFLVFPFGWDECFCFWQLSGCCDGAFGALGPGRDEYIHCVNPVKCFFIISLVIVGVFYPPLF
jgi:hypothetical protein